MRSLLRWLKRLSIALAVLVALAAIPVIWNETRCMQAPVANAASYKPIIDAPWRRDLANTWLTYPEWSIVHAYEDFAAVARATGEAEFAYLPQISGYWSRLCQLSRVASARGLVATDMKATLYIIGLSFTGEMAVKGAYESTIGRLTAWLRGPAPTPEDSFTYDVNDRYAAFLKQTPWYEFPFGGTLRRFWSEIPFSGGNVVRKIERRIGLSMEYGVKAIYAKLIGLTAGLAPADLRIRSVIAGLTDEDIKADPRMTLIARRDDGSAIIETPRYRLFTKILRGLAARGRDIVEISGNDEIFVTALAPAGTRPGDGVELVFTAPVQAKPGTERLGLSMKTARLARWLRDAPGAGVTVEHVYDY